MKYLHLVQFICASFDHTKWLAAFSANSVMCSDLSPTTDN
jgi:hypothetical protein